MTINWITIGCLIVGWIALNVLVVAFFCGIQEPGDD